MLHGVPLAWKNLTHDKRRFAVSLTGIAFAVLLMFVELGFWNAMLDSAVGLLRECNGDLVIVSKSTYTLAIREAFSTQRLNQAHGIPQVKAAFPLYFETTNSLWRDTDNHDIDKPRTHPIRVIAFDPAYDAFKNAEVDAQRHLLRRLNAVLLDRLSKEDYGKREAPMERELARKRVEVVGTFALGGDFTTDGNLIMSAETFARFFPNPLAPAETLHLAHLGLIQLEKGADPQEVKRALRARLPGDVQVLTLEEFIQEERAFWQTSTPVGFIFTFGLVIGVIVGMVICSQVLQADVASHLKEYATLKAMGYTRHVSDLGCSPGGPLAWRAGVSAFLRGLYIPVRTVGPAHRFTPLSDVGPRGRRLCAYLFHVCRGRAFWRCAKFSNPIRPRCFDVRGSYCHGGFRTVSGGQETRRRGAPHSHSEPESSFRAGGGTQAGAFRQHPGSHAGRNRDHDRPIGIRKNNAAHLDRCPAHRARRHTGSRQPAASMDLRNRSWWRYAAASASSSRLTTCFHPSALFKTSAWRCNCTTGRASACAIAPSRSLTALGLAQRIHYKPGNLSGGQRQRVAIARALSNRPRLILADEPTAALDAASGRDVVNLLKRLAEEERSSILIVTHDNRILDVADRIVNMVDGRIVSNVLVKESVSICLFLSKCEVFAGLTVDALTKVAENMSFERFEPGTTIIRQGDEGDRFYLLRRGQVDVFIDDQAGNPQYINTLREGDFFGERALLSGQVRSATIVAKDAVETYTLGKADFQGRWRPSIPSNSRSTRRIFRNSSLSAVASLVAHHCIS